MSANSSSNTSSSAKQGSSGEKVKPLQIKPLLAGNPVTEPIFHSQVRSRNGQEILVPDPRATRALISLMDMNAVLGGAAAHYGGPAAFAELMSCLHALAFRAARQAHKNWYELFNLINDAGHCENGLYALKANYGFAGLTLNDLKKFRSIESVLTGHGESHLFPEGVLLSNGPLGSAFPQAQGLAMADKLAGVDRITVVSISDGACMEGEAKEALAAVPGLARAGKLAPFLLILSDNNTKLSGRIDKESFSMEPSFKALSTLGWHVLELSDGHDLQQCLEKIEMAFEAVLANPSVPIAIHARTIKGIGVRSTQESSSGGHGFPLKSPSELPAFIKEIYSGEQYPEVFDKWIDELVDLEKQLKAKAVKPKFPTEKIQTGVSAAMIQARKEGLPVVSITSDLPGSTGTAGFRKEFPQLSFDVGVAESNMVSTAAGFSKMGFIPVVDTFAQFGVTKGALPLLMASLSQAPMICVYSHTGFQDAADGASHQSLTYLAMTNSIPDTDVYCLTSTEEANSLVYQTIQKFASVRNENKTPRSTVFFLGRENFPKTYQPNMKYQLEKAQVLYTSQGTFGKWITLLASGSMVPQAMATLERLESRGIGVNVINPAIHNKVDLGTIKPLLEKSKGKFVVVEDHQEIGGFGQTLMSQLYLDEHKKSAVSLAVKSHFGQSAYGADDLYKKHRLDTETIIQQVLEII